MAAIYEPLFVYQKLGDIRAHHMKPILKWLRSRKWFLLCCGTVLFVFVGCCAFLRISNMSDVLAFYGMFRNYHPILRDLAFRRFSKGDSMSDLLQRYPTNGPATYGHFSTFGGDNLSWKNPGNHTSVFVLAMDDRLIYAQAWGSVKDVPWEFVFFHTTNDSEILRQVDQEAERTFEAQDSKHFQKP